MTNTLTTAKTATETTSVVSTMITSTGVSPAAVGGIAAGIVGGFLLLGAATAFFVMRRPQNTNAVHAQGYRNQPMQGMEQYGNNYDGRPTSGRGYD